MINEQDIRAAFLRQAKDFNHGQLSLANQEYLKWMVELLPLKLANDVLDVAAGTGHLSRAMAPRVGSVTAYDITPEMLDEARRAAAQQDIRNMAFRQGAAESLPFEAGRFDVVTSRFAFHHMVDPSLVLREMARVCKPDGCVAVIDLVAPPDAELAERYNHVERVRDPSHTVALQPQAMLELFRRVGLHIDRPEARDVEVDVGRWLDLTHPGKASIEEIEHAIRDEMSGGAATGLRPFVREGRLKFWQTWMVVVGGKKERLPGTKAAV